MRFFRSAGRGAVCGVAAIGDSIGRVVSGSVFGERIGKKTGVVLAEI